MEKFGTFGDAATGVRPFIPIQNKQSSFKKIICLILGFIKFHMALLFLPNLFIHPFIFQYFPLNIFRIFVTRFAHFIQGHILLFLAGNYYIKVTPSPLINKMVQKEKWRKPTHGDVIISPLHSFLDLIWFSARLSPTYLIPCVNEPEFAISYSLFPLMIKLLRCKGNLQEESFFGYKVNISEFVKNSKENKRFPVVIFPEAAQTNGTGILKYQPLEFVLPQDSHIQILGFKREFNGISPNRATPNQPSMFPYLFHIFGRFYESVTVLVAMEQDVKQPKDGQVTPQYMEKVREITGKLLKLPLLSIGAEKHSEYCKECLQKIGNKTKIE